MVCPALKNLKKIQMLSIQPVTVLAAPQAIGGHIQSENSCKHVDRKERRQHKRFGGIVHGLSTISFTVTISPHPTRTVGSKNSL